MKRWIPALTIGLSFVLLIPVAAVSAAAADDTPVCGGSQATIQGTDGPDELVGTEGDDVIAALGGDDIVHGLGGNDVICGDEGDDTLFGGQGSDQLHGGSGDDTASYHQSEIRVVADLVAGTGQHGPDVDTYIDMENLTGSSGNDVLLGDGRDNVLIGGPGGDWLEGRGRRDIFVGGEGRDTVSVADCPRGGTVNLLHMTVGCKGDSWGEVHTVENINGSRFFDTLRGDAGVNAIRGRGGDDLLFGYGGDDMISGGGGRDTIYMPIGPAFVDLGAGIAQDGTGTSTLKTIENIVGSEYDDILIGNSGSNRIDGWLGDDWLIGLGGSDSLHGGPGDDLMQGGAGRDVILGYSGVDTVSYEAATNGVVVSLAGDWGSARGEGTDQLSTIQNVIGSPFADKIIGGTDENYLFGGDGRDTLIARGQSDILAGGWGNDVLRGGADDWVSYETAARGVRVDLKTNTATGQGADTLIGKFRSVLGSPFDDVLIGNGRDNTLVGMGGDDRFVGGGGDDFFVGGSGNDSFVGGSGWDAVTYEMSPTGVSVNLTSGVGTGDGTDSFSSIEGLAGSMFDDILTGSPQTNTIVPLAGDDRVDGGGGSDDTVSFLHSPAPMVIDLAAETANGEGADVLERIDNVVGTALDDVIRGNDLANTLWGWDGDDLIDGRGGSDVLIGGEGEDTLIGGSGTDTCIDRHTHMTSCEVVERPRARRDLDGSDPRSSSLWGWVRAPRLGPDI